MTAARLLLLASAAAMLSAAALPEKGPVPLRRPETAQPQRPENSGDNLQKPESKEKGKGRTEEPVGTAEDTPQSADKPDETPVEALVVEPEAEAEHAACLAQLRTLQTAFELAPRIDDGRGCGIDRPIVVSEVLPGIRLEPAGPMRCATALALARWMKDSVVPAARVAAGDAGAITAVNQASAYVCRLRNNAETGKISEHARGNAIDIASFSFEKGDPIEIKPRREDATLSGAFQRTVSASACLYFSTVLDPESDAAHENHLHLDVLERKRGYRYCR